MCTWMSLEGMLKVSLLKFNPETWAQASGFLVFPKYSPPQMICGERNPTDIIRNTGECHVWPTKGCNCIYWSHKQWKRNLFQKSCWRMFGKLQGILVLPVGSTPFLLGHSPIAVVPYLGFGTPPRGSKTDFQQGCKELGATIFKRMNNYHLVSFILLREWLPH